MKTRIEKYECDNDSCDATHKMIDSINMPDGWIQLFWNPSGATVRENMGDLSLEPHEQLHFCSIECCHEAIGELKDTVHGEVCE